MPWNAQGGGPWGPSGGGGGGSKGPWGGGGRGGGGNGPWGGGGRNAGPGGPTPPNFDDMVRKGQQRLKRFFPGGMKPGAAVILVLIVAVVIWLATGFYRVLPEEQGVVQRFGKHVATTPAGLHYHLPWPIERVTTPQVERLNRIDVGFQSAEATFGQSSPQQDIPEESLMLTGDENIIDIDFSIIWRIKDGANYLFNIRNPPQTIKAVGESVMREIIGQTPIQPALTEARAEIEDRTRRLLQEELNNYSAGVTVTQVQMQKVDPPQPVIDAFNDVQRARADRERFVNEAEAYRNEILPRARGERERIIQQAEAYREEVQNRAQGQAQRFLQVLEGYRTGPQATRQRLYIETMESILSDADKYMMQGASGGAAGAGGGAQQVVPYLPLPELERRRQQDDGDGDGENRDGTNSGSGNSGSGNSSGGNNSGDSGLFDQQSN